MKEIIRPKSKRKLLLMISTRGKTPKEVRSEAVRILKSKVMINKLGQLMVKEKSNKNNI